MKKQTKILVWNPISVELTRKPIRNLYLRVRPDGQVTVSAPLRLPEAEILRFLEERREWIAARQEEMARRRERGLSWEGDGERISLWGKPYALRVETGAPRAKVRQEPEAVVLCLPGEDSLERRKALTREWYRKALRQEVERLFPEWERRLGVEGGGWQIRAMRSRWGSCGTQTGKILLNLYLAAYPRECLEYVIVHELAHRQIPHHGPEFWALVERYLPDWRERRKKLLPV